MSQLNLEPLDNRNLIQNTGLQQSETIRQFGDNIQSQQKEKRELKRQNELIALDKLNVDLASYTSSYFMGEQNKLIEAFETKWAEKWKSKRGFTNQDLVELTRDQKNIERAQAEMLVNDNVFSKAYELVKTDDKGMYDKGKFAQYYADFMQTGKVPTQTTTGVPFLDYADVDLDSWLTNVKNEYRNKNERELGETYSEKSGKRIFNKVYEYGSDDDARAYIGNAMTKDPRIITTLRKGMLSEGKTYDGSSTPTLDYLTEKMGGLKSFTERRSTFREADLPERSSSDKKEEKVVIEKNGNSWQFNDRPITLTGVNGTEKNILTELVENPENLKGLYFKAIVPLDQQPIPEGATEDEEDKIVRLNEVNKGKFKTKWIPYDNVKSVVKYDFKDLGDPKRPAVSLERQEETNVFPVKSKWSTYKTK